MRHSKEIRVALAYGEVLLSGKERTGKLVFPTLQE